MKLLRLKNNHRGPQIKIFRFRINQDNLSKCRIWFRHRIRSFLSHSRKNLTLERNLDILDVFVMISCLQESLTKLCLCITTKSTNRTNQWQGKHHKTFQGKHHKTRSLRILYNLMSPLVLTLVLHFNESYKWKNKNKTSIKLNRI